MHTRYLPHLVLVSAALITACGGSKSFTDDDSTIDTDVDPSDTATDDPTDGHADPDVPDGMPDSDDPLPETGDPSSDSPLEALDAEPDATTCSPRLLILVDRSASMEDDSPNRWTQVRQALDSFLGSPASDGIGFGLGAFPTDDNCATDASLVVHPVPDADRTSVATFFASMAPGGNTPLVGALEFLASDSTANIDEAGYSNAMVLITDGWECCIRDCVTECMGSPDMIGCLTTCQGEMDAEAPLRLDAAAQDLRDTHEVRTFVIGISDDVKEDQLSAIASKGGTVSGEWLSARGTSGIEEALAAIADELRECHDIVP